MLFVSTLVVVAVGEASQLISQLQAGVFPKTGRAAGADWIWGEPASEPRPGAWAAETPGGLGLCWAVLRCGSQPTVEARRRVTAAHHPGRAGEARPVCGHGM